MPYVSVSFVCEVPDFDAALKISEVLKQASQGQKVQSFSVDYTGAKEGRVRQPSGQGPDLGAYPTDPFDTSRGYYFRDFLSGRDFPALGSMVRSRCDRLLSFC